jgi:hypothetical protein
MAENSLTLSFRRLRQRLLAVGGCTAAAWGVTAVLALVATGVWLDLIWELSSVVRIAACVVAAAAGGTLAAVTFAATLGRCRERALARRLDDSAHTGGQILSGHDLIAGPATAAQTAPLTAGLAQLAVARAARLAAEVPVALAVPAKPARRAGSSMALVAASIGLAALVAPRLASTEWLRFADPFGNHPPYSRTVLKVEPGNTRVLYGGSLEVLVTTEGPVADQVEIVLLPIDESVSGDEQTLPMFPEAGGKWRTQIAELHVPIRYFARAHSARSHRYGVDVVTVPQIESVTWRIAPPAYTREAVFEGPLPPTGLAGLQGTQVQVVAESNRPLAKGSIEVLLGEGHAGAAPEFHAIPLVPLAEGSRRAVGAFEITAAGKLTLGVTDVAGQDSLDKFQGTISVLADERPFVRLLEPPAVSLATPTATLPVAVAAEDDYGVARLQLFRSLNDSRALPIDLPLETPPPRGAQAAVYLPLSEYGLEPGDVIKLYARVEDNDPAGAKGSESAVAVVQIIAAADYERMMRAREGMDVLLSKYQQAQRRMEALAEEIEGLRKKLAALPPHSPAELPNEAGQSSEAELREQLERLAQRLEEEAKAVRESAEQLLPYDLDKSLTEQLDQVAERFDQAAQDARSLAAKPGAKAGEMANKLSELKKLLAQKKEQFANDVSKPMQDLADVYPLLEDSSRFVELYHRQRDLAERLNSLAGRDHEDDPALKARMRDLEGEQRGVREELGRLLDDIENHAARVPDREEFRELVATALQFADAVRASGAGEAMSLGEAGLADFSGTQGHAGAKQAAEILEQFIKRCEGMCQACEGACNGLRFAPSESNPRGEGLGNTLAQLLADAGFKPGQGQGQGQPSGEKMGTGVGQGSGGGYSARRSSLENIGLYGNLPTRGQPSRQGSGRGRMAMGGQGSGQGNTSRSPGGFVRGGDAMRAAGASEAVVPIRYRARVEQYFQRVAEETGR